MSIIVPARLVVVPARSHEWPRVGDVNCLEASIGNRGEGKSTLQATRAYELQRQYNGIVLGHSFGRRMPNALPTGIYGGERLPLRYYRSVDQLEIGLRKHPRDWHFIAPPLKYEDPAPHLRRSSADELLQYAMRLSFALRWQAWRRANPSSWAALTGRLPKNGVDFKGLRVPPVIVVIDEGIAVGAAAGGERGKRKEEDSEWFVEMTTSMRHLHMCLLYALQEPTMRSWRILAQATRVNVFYIEHEWALNAIRASGASIDQIDEIRALRPFEHVQLTFGRDRVQNADAIAAAAQTGPSLSNARPPEGGGGAGAGGAGAA
jgi:hypothetical protein